MSTRSTYWAVGSLAILLSVARTPAVAAPAKAPEEVAPARAAAKIDLNRATSAQLQQLPGINKFWATRIIGNRPYHSVAALKKAGLGPTAIAQLKPLATVVIYKPTQPAETVVAPRVPVKSTPMKLDLNSASLEQLQNLPGVEPGMAAHILAGRPYVNLDDLARNGVPFNTIDKIRPLVTVGP